ncbi:FAD:protein FMN transferase [Massilia aquatica]|uniref:FAD:protein FMN transferase n=1 Tax=Massilia aquatica TaxID=2609000 RepID=UPI001E39F08A|nr:FAD:protein FMN transferase [Massilia aquatica]
MPIADWILPRLLIRRWLDARPRMADLRYQDNTVASTNKAVMIDLGGYAKGYALDRAALILRRSGVEAALVNVGGNLIAIGQPGERPWRVGIKDPRSGYPIDLVASVTIITAGGLDAGLRSDGNSKPMFITGPAGWQAMAAQMGLAEVMLIDAQGQVPTTAPMRARLATAQQGRVASE